VRLAFRVECHWSLWTELLQEGILGQPTILEWALTDETEAAAFTNLLMVGFDPVPMERKHATSFDRRMLRKTNERAGDCATTSDSTRVRSAMRTRARARLTHLRQA